MGNFEEHILRLLDIVGKGCDSESQLLASVSFLMLVPVCTASSERARLLEEEAAMTASLGSLNPPACTA